MKLKEIGEFGFIERFKPLFGGLVQGAQVGIGDDCAIIPANDKEDWLVTTDLLMEDVHFLRNEIKPEELGYKSLAVNLSDIAAMGGTPLGSFLSIAIPADMEVACLDAFMQGYHQLSSKYNTPLLGGDTTKSLKHLAINVCVIGKCPKGKARRRSMAQAGDVIAVTGNLGGSAGGLQVLLQKRSYAGLSAELVQNHHLPEPRLNEGLFLAGFDGIHAMMDISDGVASDLVHILKASGKSAVVDTDKLPFSETLRQMADEFGWDAIELAASGGEDYELLFTVAPEDWQLVQKEFTQKFGKPLYAIGKITDGEARINWQRNGQTISFRKSGFNHFQ
jgi:thiamine-monophosphate kinase